MFIYYFDEGENAGQFSLQDTRNIGIMAHIDAGKTATEDTLLAGA